LIWASSEHFETQSEHVLHCCQTCALASNFNHSVTILRKITDLPVQFNIKNFGLPKTTTSGNSHLKTAVQYGPLDKQALTYTEHVITYFANTENYAIYFHVPYHKNI
jgi:hypothetical protein